MESRSTEVMSIPRRRAVASMSAIDTSAMVERRESVATKREKKREFESRRR